MNFDLVASLKDLAIATSIVFAIVAVLGIGIWRKELRSKPKFDVAQKLMILAFQLKADFEWVRNPAGWSWEYTNRIERQNELPQEKELLNQWYSKNERLKPLTANLQRLEEAAWKAEAVLGKDTFRYIPEAIEAYKRKYSELSTAIYSLFEARRREVTSGEPFKNQEYLKELHKILYSSADDAFSKSIEEATSTLASALKTNVK
jgi:hypothetical protein